MSVPTAGAAAGGPPGAAVQGSAQGSALSALGVDAVDVPRFRSVLARRPALAGRLFTGRELAYAEEARDPAQRLAARFAAKEAVMKALGIGIGAVSFLDIEVARSEDSGAPSLELSGRAADLAAERRVGGWHLSMTHTDAVAIAVVAAEPDRSPQGARRAPPPGEEGSCAPS